LIRGSEGRPEVQTLLIFFLSFSFFLGAVGASSAFLSFSGEFFVLSGSCVKTDHSTKRSEMELLILDSFAPLV
jgi:hypothetical protein